MDIHSVVREAFSDDNPALLKEILAKHPELKRMINEPVGPFDSPPILLVKSPEMLDVLLEAGADIQAKSRWWAGGFGILHQAGPELAAHAIRRGAAVDVHAAARLGMLELLRDLVGRDPSLVHARGGDGQTPLHFASTVEIAEFLIASGGDLDARDLDHESTPAQHGIRDRQEVVKYLVSRGCRTDIFIAAALGDLELTDRHVQANRACLELRVNEECFPKADPRAGGTIYLWTLGWHVSPHEVARQFGHEQVWQYLLEESPIDTQLLVALWTGETPTARAILAQDPGLFPRLSDGQKNQLAHAARNNNTEAVSAMLEVGFPVTAQGQHGATPLHWAAFHGNSQMTRELLKRRPPLEVKDRDFHGTPLGWAIHGSEHGWHARSGDYPAVVEQLLNAGASLPENPRGGTAPIQQLLRQRTAG